MEDANRFAPMIEEFRARAAQEAPQLNQFRASLESDESGDTDFNLLGRLTSPMPQPATNGFDKVKAAKKQDPCDEPKADSGLADGPSSSATASADSQSAMNDSEPAEFKQKKARAERLGEKLSELQELSMRVQKGDKAAQAAIELMLDGDQELWQCFGDVGGATEQMLLDELADKTPSIHAMSRRFIADLRESISNDNPTPLQRMALRNVTISWLFVQFADRSCLRAVQQHGRASDLGKLQETAERRFQIALKSLKLANESANSRNRAKAKTNDTKHDADLTSSSPSTTCPPFDAGLEQGGDELSQPSFAA